VKSGTAGRDAAAGAGAVVVVLVTHPDEAGARALVTALVEERLAACGNIVPGVESIYRWQGALEQARECLVILKTTAAEVGRLIERIPALHPYEVPEILALPVAAGHAGYLAWVAGNAGNS
jgi:periplasmic divalent cation tolerance protein